MAAQTIEYANAKRHDEVDAIAKICAYGDADVRSILLSTGWDLSQPRAQKCIHETLVIQERISVVTITSKAVDVRDRIDIFKYLVSRIAEVSISCIDAQETKAYKLIQSGLEGTHELSADYKIVVQYLDLIQSFLAHQYEVLE